MPTETLTIHDAASQPYTLAFEHVPGRTSTAPGAIWLGGLKSDMTSGKAAHLAAWARDHGVAFTRFDYRGHGVSGGRFEQCTTSDWLADALAVLERVTSGPQVLIGSSMGGWIALLLARALVANSIRAGAGHRVVGLILIAPAWDMTERLMWNEATAGQRRAIIDDGVWHRPSGYGDGRYPITRALIEDGRRHSLAGQRLDFGAMPVRIIHGMARCRCAVAGLARARGHDRRRRPAADAGQRWRTPVVATRRSARA